MADVLIVTSIYDGMNLVAKEYLASQVHHNGMLLLSHLAGAAEVLREALIINPYDTEGVAEAMKEALEMPSQERADRLGAMQRYLETHDVENWIQGCTDDAMSAVSSVFR